jgi:hypothetical protein
MNVNSIFLDAVSLQSTSGMYGVVSSMCGEPNYGRFTEQYVNKVMLVDELQTRLNELGQKLCELPDEADRTVATAEWQTLKSVLEEIRAL